MNWATKLQLNQLQFCGWILVALGLVNTILFFNRVFTQVIIDDRRDCWSQLLAEGTENRAWRSVFHHRTPDLNHLTVWNALKCLPKPHSDMMKRMGFDFSAKFDKENGANGKLPIHPDEWRAIGLETDEKSWNLLNYCYRIAS